MHPPSSRPSSGTSGPGQQPIAVDKGYDQVREDELFDAIGWPADGYRLFEISHFIGERDWFDGVLESNCLFVPRSLLEQVGAFDDSFSMPGGGYANLDLWERLGSAPDVTTVTILGEGSFHQVHGGTTTNDAAHDDRRTQDLRVRPRTTRSFAGACCAGRRSRLHYVGNALGRRRAPHPVAPHDRVGVLGPARGRRPRRRSRRRRSRFPTS